MTQQVNRSLTGRPLAWSMGAIAVAAIPALWLYWSRRERTLMRRTQDRLR